MYRIDVSAGKINYSQRNNEIDPMDACGPTSIVMAVSYIPQLWKAFTESPYFEKYNVYPQEEDRFHASLKEWNLNREVHADLASGINRWVGYEADVFSTSVTLADVVKDLRKGLPVVMSGTFPGYPAPMASPYNHIVCVVGAEWLEKTDMDSQSPVNWLVDDPFGNTMDNWKGSGNNVVIPYSLFNEWMKFSGITDYKWAHRFQVKNEPENKPENQRGLFWFLSNFFKWLMDFIGRLFGNQTRN